MKQYNSILYSARKQNELLHGWHFAADYEGSTTGCKFFLATENREKFFTENLNNSPNLYEIIKDNTPCCFVADLDGCEIFEPRDFELFEQTFIEFLDKKREGIAVEKFVWLEANKPTTGSYHFLAHCSEADEPFGFGRLKNQKSFWAEFPRLGKWQDVGGKSVIDLNIYTTNRLFRLPYSTKAGQNRPLKLRNPEQNTMVKYMFVTQPDIKQIYDLNEIVWGPQQKAAEYKIGGNFPEEFENVKKILEQCPMREKQYWQYFGRYLSMLFKIKFMLGDKGYELARDFFIQCGWSQAGEIINNAERYESLVPKYFCDINDFREFCQVPFSRTESELENILFLEEEIAEPQQQTPIERPPATELNKQDLEIQHWLATTKIEIKSEKFGLRLANVLSSFLQEKTKHICESFFKLHMPKSEGLLEMVFKNPSKEVFNIIDLIGMLKINVTKWDEEYCEEKLRPYVFRDKHLFIKSGTGTGKTFQIMKQFGKIEQKKILFVCYRTSLAYDLCTYKNHPAIGELDVGHYLEEDIKNGERMPNIFMCQLESLHKFSDKVRFFDIVVFDESENIISQLNNLKRGCAVSRTRLCLSYILQKKPIICMSANLGQRTFNFVRKFSNREIYAIKNTYQDKTDYVAELYMGWEEKIYSLARAGKKLAIAVNSCAKAELLYAAFCEMKINALLMTSKTKSSNFEVMKNVNESWVKFDVVIYTATIEAGVSFDVKGHFDYICGNFKSKQSNNYLSQFQSLFRVRHPVEKTLILTLSKDTDENKYFPLSKANLIKLHGIDEYTRKLSIDDRINFRITDLGVIQPDYEDPLNLQLIENIAFDDYSRAFQKSLLLNELFDCGCKIVDAEESKKYKQIKIFDKIVETVSHNPTYEEKEFKKITIQAAMEFDIRETFTSPEEVYKHRRNVFISAGIFIGKVAGSEEMPEIICEQNIYTARELYKAHKNLQNATKHIVNFKKIDKFHRFLQKRKLIEMCTDDLVKDNYKHKFESVGTHYHNSAKTDVIKAHKLINLFGYYSGKKYSYSELITAFGKHLLNNNNAETYNVLFKSGKKSRWITKQQIVQKDSAKKIKSYVAGILSSYNICIKKSGEEYFLAEITPITRKTIEGFKKKIGL